MSRPLAAQLAAGPWQAVASGAAQLHITRLQSVHGPTLRLDYDFRGGRGFVVARCELRLSLPAAYALSFMLRGSGAVNHFELKLVDASGQSVWRHRREHFAPPRRWARLRLTDADLPFAWGAAGGGELREVGALEIAVVAGEGGRGRLWLAGWQLDDTSLPAPELHASSAQRGHAAARALDEAGWRPRADDARPWIELRFARDERPGGLLIDWCGAAPAGGFRLRGASRQGRWRRLHEAPRAGGARSAVYLGDVRVARLRLEIGGAVAGLRLRFAPHEHTRSYEAFRQGLARAARRGLYPRWMTGEQSLWTPAGTAAGSSALINEQGQAEIDAGAFMVEPMLRLDGRLHTWADVLIEQTLEAGWMPDPGVCWHGPHWRLRLRAQAGAAGRLRLHYRVENCGAAPLRAELLLLLRPLQVTPPWQRHGGFGGLAPIRRIAWCDGVLEADAHRLRPRRRPSRVGVLAGDEGDIAERLDAGDWPPRSAAEDGRGELSGALAFDLRIAAGGHADTRLLCARAGDAQPLRIEATRWARLLPIERWQAADWGGDALGAMHTAAAHILATRQGAALQPGPRRYRRSWIRDGAIMSAALLRMGCAAPVRDFIRWYVQFQRADGFVPCCVDERGADWLIEHDSHGELIALVADYHRFTRDDALLAQLWPAVDRAAACIEKLLDELGLLPLSASHEGYLAEPVHSYWDDFWGLRGLHDAAAIAAQLGHARRAAECEAAAARLADALYASIEATRHRKGLDFIPASVEWADFDPTATANALLLFGVPPRLDRAALQRTFQRYLDDWRAKRRGTMAWTQYSPYEIRIIGACLRLGWREAAIELLHFFLDDRRPRAWNQWPEIAWRDPLAPAHVGDVPHSWIAAEYVLALRSMLVYEDEATRSLVLAAGVAPEWLDGAGLRLDGVATAFGALSLRLCRLDAHRLRCEIDAGPSAERLVLRPPLPGIIETLTVECGAAVHDADSVTVTRLPASLILDCAANASPRRRRKRGEA